jgi:hypothetical protein
MGDKGDLIEFLAELQKDLNLIIENIDKIVPEIEKEKELYDLLMQSWHEVSDEFERVKGYVRDKLPSSEMENVGLTGVQLQLKITLYRKVSAEFKDVIQSLNSPIKISDVLKKIIKIIRLLVKIADTILDSLSKIVTGTDIIGEAKDTIGNIIDLVDLIRS